MLQLPILSLLFLSCVANPTPARIYNVLITSKKNLSPSHAQPVYEPVLRTTSIGYAFPPFYYTSLVQNIPSSYITQDYSGFQRTESLGTGHRQEVPQNGAVGQQQVHTDLNQAAKISSIPQLNNQPEPEPPTQQFISQYNPATINYAQYLQKDEENSQKKPPSDPPLQQFHEETDPKKVIANLRRNNGIPDVPPPPLPVRNVKQ